MIRTRKKRNRKKRVDGYLIPVPFVSVLVAMGIAALAYLWMISRCEAIGAEIKTLEAEQAELIKRYNNEDLKWTRMKAPRELERILTRNGVRMNYPSPDQVVLLADARPVETTEFDEQAGQRRYAGMRRTGRYE